MHIHLHKNVLKFLNFIFMNLKLLQKHPFRNILEESCSKNMQQIYRETPMPKCDFNKVASNFTEIALRHGCSPVNLLHIFRTPFHKNISGWLLLSFISYCFNNNSQCNSDIPVNHHAKGLFLVLDKYCFAYFIAQLSKTYWRFQYQIKCINYVNHTATNVIWMWFFFACLLKTPSYNFVTKRSRKRRIWQKTHITYYADSRESF